MLNGNNPTATVPCQPNQPVQRTISDLHTAGFTDVPTPVQQTSETVPAGSVIRCSPTGTQPLDTKITVFVSSGTSTQMVLVPSVFCLPTNTARSTLTKLGFHVQTGGNDRGSTCTTPGFVASQEPAAYTEQPFGSVVTLLLVPQPTTTPPPTTTTPPPTTTPPTHATDDPTADDDDLADRGGSRA